MDLKIAIKLKIFLNIEIFQYFNTFNNWRYLSNLKMFQETVFYLPILGGFQMEFVSIGRVINHMTSYNSSTLISWNKDYVRMVRKLAKNQLPLPNF